MLAKSPHHPNHHLWNNHGTWWLHATVLYDGVRQERIRRSLGTRDLIEARQRRDEFLADLGRQSNPRLSLRIGRPRRRQCSPEVNRAAGNDGSSSFTAGGPA
jgi:hypothetical protein